MEIVSMTPNNVEILDIFLENKLPSTFRYFSRRTVDCIRNHLITIVGTINSIPIAYGHIDKDDTDTYWLGVCIIDGYQSNGYGTAIVNYLIEHVSINIIHLTVDKINTNAISLYKKLGFLVVDEYDTYYKMRLDKAYHVQTASINR